MHICMFKVAVLSERGFTSEQTLYTYNKGCCWYLFW